MTDTNTRDRFTPETRTVIAAAKKSVLDFQHTHITPEHILLALLTEGGERVAKAFQSGTASLIQVRELVHHHLRKGDQQIPEEFVNFSERAKRVIEAARLEAQRAKANQIAPEHLLIGLTQVSNTVCGAVLRAVELDDDKIKSVLGAP